MNLKWWEKTVEYEFVLLVADSNKLFLAPLDGREEMSGDAVFSSNYQWVLIEFKKDLDSISTENKKFADYNAAFDDLSSRDGHHYIIYGQESGNPPHRLVLCFRTYFSNRICDLKGILSSGTGYENFKKYVEDYTKFKKQASGGSGGVTMDGLALVAGVNTDKTVVECLSLTEFQLQLELEHNHELERNPITVDRILRRRTF
jgi:hypothetical protein